MKYVIAFILGAVCGIAVGKMAEEEDQRLREMCRDVDHERC